MTQLSTLKAALATAIALCGVVATAPAQARPDPVIVVNVNTPARVVQTTLVSVQHVHAPARVISNQPHVVFDPNRDRSAVSQAARPSVGRS